MLIIIESPNKIKKIRQITGANVLATVGHFKDLPTDELAVDLETYKPSFRIMEGKSEVIKKIKAAAKGENVYVASDPDREGGAIAQHIYEEIRTVAKSIRRAEIREITEKGVKLAVAAAIPYDQVNKGIYAAFLGRRVGDRLVGYLLSPLACAELHGKYSVGRVQSPAVRLVVEREREIRDFKPEPFWTVAIILEKDLNQFKAIHIAGKFTDLATATAACNAVKNSPTALTTTVETAQKKQHPKPPFTTVDMQVAANNQLKFPPEKAMKLCQQLFEVGLITYHRTDSFTISTEFIEEMRQHVVATLGPEYISPVARQYKSKTSQAEAHEAIRPTHMHLVAEIPDILSREGLTTEHEQIYGLIYRRAVASQMASATYDTTTAMFECGGENFKATGRVETFAGFLAMYSEAEANKDGEDADQDLPVLLEGEHVLKIGEELAEKKTKAPSRFTEGSLVKELERLGIGRPSTYASIMAVIKTRGYVSIQKSKIHAEPPGEALLDYLIASASWCVEYDMTRKMEAYLDKVESGGASWQVFAKGVHSKMGFRKPALRTTGDGPPSAAAMKYAIDIARTKGINLPGNAETSAQAVKAFLDTHAPKHSTVKSHRHSKK